MKNIILIRNILLALLIFFIFQNEMIAQQLPLINQNRQTLNPSFIHSGFFKYELPSNLSLRFRSQWTKHEDMPITVVGDFSHWNEEYSFLTGGEIINDKTGPTSFTGLFGKAAYGIELGEEMLLTIGLKGGVLQYRVNGADLNFFESGDIASTNVTKIFPDFSVGTTLYFQEKYYLGFSVPQTFGLNLKFRTDENNFNIERVQHYYGILGARFSLENDSWIETSSEVRYVQNIPFYVNAKLMYDYQEMFWLGVSGSNTREFGVDLGIILNIGTDSHILRCGYSFTNFFQEFGPHFGSTHEIGFSYSL
ncbi:MAG: PorP/SprF family type IX secretion system membrane protein [Saprospiraceae bacterium]